MTDEQPQLTFFLDSSAVVKRYAREIGTTWVEELCAPDSKTVIALAEISLVEVAAALAAKRRGNFIEPQEYEKALDDLRADSKEHYLLVAIEQTIIESAIQLTRRRKLRGCDAVQLASALALNKTLLDNEMIRLTFVSADIDLIDAASAEGLAIENPNTHLESRTENTET